MENEPWEEEEAHVDWGDLGKEFQVPMCTPQGVHGTCCWFWVGTYIWPCGLCSSWGRGRGAAVAAAGPSTGSSKADSPGQQLQLSRPVVMLHLTPSLCPGLCLFSTSGRRPVFLSLTCSWMGTCPGLRLFVLFQIIASLRCSSDYATLLVMTEDWV